MRGLLLIVGLLALLAAFMLPSCLDANYDEYAANNALTVNPVENITSDGGGRLDGESAASIREVAIWYPLKRVIERRRSRAAGERWYPGRYLFGNRARAC